MVNLFSAVKFDRLGLRLTQFMAAFIGMTILFWLGLIRLVTIPTRADPFDLPWLIRVM